MFPCFNPEKEWYKGLLEFYEATKNNYDLNFILVNDGSTKQNLQQDIEFIKQKGIPINHIGYELNKGKGFALREGVKNTKEKFIVYTDVDFPFETESIKSIINCVIVEGADIAVGYRKQDYYQNDFSANRKYLSKAFRFFLKYFLRMKITDTQCGLKGFSEKGKHLFLKTTINRYLFDFEFIYMASHDKSYNMMPVEVKLKKGIKFSKMKTKVLLQESFNLFLVLVKNSFSRKVVK